MAHARAKGGETGDMIKKQAIEDALSLLPSGARIDDVSLSGENYEFLHRLNTDE